MGKNIRYQKHWYEQTNQNAAFKGTQTNTDRSESNETSSKIRWNKIPEIFNWYFLNEFAKNQPTAFNIMPVWVTFVKPFWEYPMRFLGKKVL